MFRVQHAVEERLRSLPGEVQPAHVRHVEDAAALARLLVLVDDRRGK